MQQYTEECLFIYLFFFEVPVWVWASTREDLSERFKRLPPWGGSHTSPRSRVDVGHGSRVDVLKEAKKNRES